MTKKHHFRRSSDLQPTRFPVGFQHGETPDSTDLVSKQGHDPVDRDVEIEAGASRLDGPEVLTQTQTSF